MKLRDMIILMTALAVVSDAILIPFYPQFFAARYGDADPVHAGSYVAFISIAVMLTLPLWARVAKRLDAMHLLVYTQCAAGMLSLASYWASSVALFWVMSLAMFMCKSSYLLMYPYMMRREEKTAHAHTIGVLSVVVHFGAISGALVGGFVMQVWDARACIFAMAAGDFAQMAICVWLIRSHAIARRCRFADDVAADADGDVDGEAGTRPPAVRPRLRDRLPMFRLAILMLAFDFCAYLIRPFTAAYWQSVSGSPSEVLSGLVFAIPGIVALVALRVNRRIAARGGRLPDHVIPNLLLCAAGMLLQGIADPLWLVLGRVLFGWAFFQIVVKLDVTMFALSKPASYAADFSLINFFQNLGVLLASFAAGSIVDAAGLRAPFLIGSAALGATAVMSLGLLERRIPGDPAGVAPTRAPATADVTSAEDLAETGVPAHAK